LAGVADCTFPRDTAQFAVSLVLAMACPTVAAALCRSYIADGTRQGLRYSYICENTYSNPAYLIVRQFIGVEEQWFFEFAPKDMGLLCSGGQFNGHVFKDCHAYASGPLPTAYDGGIAKVRLYDLDDPLQSAEALKHAYVSPGLFRYPDVPVSVGTEGCAISVASDKQLNIFYTASRPGDLSECLLQFEIYATSAWREFMPE
jgi:hypothetical protein